MAPLKPLIHRVAGKVARLRAEREDQRVLHALPPAPDPWPVAAAAPNTFFDSGRLKDLAPFDTLLRRFSRQMRSNLPRWEGVRVWEYGVLLSLVQDGRGMRVLDGGVGGSTFPHFLGSLGASVSTLDLPAPFDAAFAAAEPTPRPARVAGTMLSLPFADASFDVVLSISALEHLQEHPVTMAVLPVETFVHDTTTALREMCRVLKPGGVFYLTSEAADHRRAAADDWYKKKVAGRVVSAYSEEELKTDMVPALTQSGVVLENPDFDLAAAMQDKSRWNFRGEGITTFCFLGKKQGG